MSGSGLPPAWQRGSSCELLCGWKVDGDLRHAVKIVADRLVADDHDRIDQIGLRPTSAEERVSRFRRNMSALLCDLTDEAGQRVQPGVERRAAVSNFDDLRFREAQHLADSCVRGEAIFAGVDLAHDEVDDLALFRP